MPCFEQTYVVYVVSCQERGPFQSSEHLAVYSLLFTLLVSTLLSRIQFNYSTTPVMSILFGSSSPHSLGTLFLDTNIHKLLEHKIKGGVLLSSFQCSHCVCMLKPARDLEPEKGEKGGGNLCTKVLVTERSP